MSKAKENLRDQLASAPDELKQLPTWVCYRLEQRVGQEKPTKVPYDPRTGEKAKADDPTTWTDFETCLAAAERGAYDGIGFEFGNGFAGVDLDHCRNPETGELEPWAADVIAHLDSYTEASPSGTGVHIIIQGALPPGRRRIGPVEMYDSGRFFTVTGNHIDGTPSSVEERSEELRELHEALFPPETPAEPIAAAPEDSTDALTDEEIIEKASQAANGEKFKKLWAGDWQGAYNSHSEADEALCCHLAFWTGKDPDRIDNLFRKSGLYRQKWDRADYRTDTITRAINRTQATYTISRRDRTARLYAGLAADRSLETSTSSSPEAGQQAAPSTGTDKDAPRSDESNSKVEGSSGFRFSLTDLGNSERFIALHGNSLRYCPETKTWLEWTGELWAPDKLIHVNELAKSTVRAMYAELALEKDPDKRKELFGFIQKSESERSLNALVNLAKSDPRIATSITAFDAQLHLLNCKNGTVDLRTGSLQLHRREDLLTKQCPVVFDANAKSEVWDRFLSDCTGGNKELKNFLQQAAGYSLYGDPREQVLFMVHGPGATGKSTFLAAVMAVLGEYAKTADFSTFLKKQNVSCGPSDDVASLAGARLVSSIEVNNGQRLAEALVKQLTGGDTIRARHLYRDSFEFKPQLKLWLICNEPPVVSHDDDAIWRRLLRLPFEHVIPPAKRDKNLRAALTDSAQSGPAILKWLVDGCVDWFQNGLRIPDCVRIATEVYKQESNPLADFVAECCVIAPTVYAKVSDMRIGYENWRKESGEPEQLNRTQFIAAMRDMGCTPGVREGARVWIGIALRDDDSQVYLAYRSTKSAFD